MLKNPHDNDIMIVGDFQQTSENRSYEEISYGDIMLFTVVWLMFLVLAAHGAPQNMVTHLIDAFQPVKCFSVICHAGSQLSFCKRNKTSDYCHQCPLGSSQPIRVDSSKIREMTEVPKCLPIDINCPPEAVPILENGKTTGCQCDTLRGYVGRNFRLCQRYSKCPPGMAFQSQDGMCSPCPAGSFSSVQSYHPCTPHTKCKLHNRETILVGNATMDTVCGDELETRVGTYPAVTTLAVLHFHDMADISDGYKETMQSGSIEGETPKVPSDSLLVKSQSHTNSILTLAVLVMGISTCVLAVLLSVVICRSRKRRNESRTTKTNVTSREALVQKSDNETPDMTTHEPLVQKCDNDKPGIQAEDDCGSEVPPVATIKQQVVSDDTALDWDGDKQPGTLTVYPQINAVPCTPTAPPGTPSLII